MIDLRFSGEINLAADTTGVPMLPAERPYFYEANADDVAVIFNASGGIDRYYFSYYDPGPPLGAFPAPGVYGTSRIPQSSLQFLNAALYFPSRNELIATLPSSFDF